MGRYPISSAGLLIMITAVVVGFVPSIWSILFLFATTIFGGFMIKKHAGKEAYDQFVKYFGWAVAGANFVAAGMMMMTPLNYIDKASGAFLSMMIGMVILTLIYNNGKTDNI